MNPLRSSRRRLVLAIVVCFAVVAVFTVRLVDIQVVRADELNKDSLSKRAIAVTSYAPRGDIVDANGVILATSVNRYWIIVAPRNVDSFTHVDKNKVKSTITVMDAANEIASVTKQDPAVVFQALTKDPNSNYSVVSKGLDAEALREVRALKIPWVGFETHSKRTYPNGSVAGNLVGFVGTDGPQAGLEAADDKCLSSTNGSLTYEQGADGVQIPGSSITTKAAKPGGTLKTTIDSDLQWFSAQAVAEQAMAIGAKSATVSVTRIKDAHLMALVDWPAVDPNDVNGTPVANLGALSFSTPYEPGSTFKAMTAAMLIDSGTANPLTQATVPARWTTPEGGFIRDATGHPTERLTLTGVLQQSSNVGISMIGSRLAPSIRYDYMRKFGLGEKTAIDMGGEQSAGILAKKWDDQTKYNVMYGQGVSATAVQMASIYQTLGNGGVRLPLTLVEGCQQADGTMTDLPPTAGVRVVSDQAAKTVVNMLESVVTGGELSKSLKIPGYRIAAKSGTAEVAVNGRYTGDRVVSVAGIAPAEDPQYSVIVTFTKPDIMKSSAAAAPTFHKIMSEVLTKYRVPPSTTPSTSPATTW
ncbi:peptidoglycan D,D-transpeptidase FtsI family protein [Lacisediminihabitans profunda]|uniref:peptidoglycan D,D-transpeptidase FtsI family protein n=1 Tax=Lacisediminihabitans profunda TaxID=2594790 RepID=UPI001FE6BE21|nr:penicillin-binding protein 2 [Lacisediminihabitans profunda]